MPSSWNTIVAATALALTLTIADTAPKALAQNVPPSIEAGCVASFTFCFIQIGQCTGPNDTIECCQQTSALVDCVLDSPDCSVADAEAISQEFTDAEVDLDEFRRPEWCEQNFDEYLVLIDAVEDVVPDELVATASPAVTSADPDEQSDASSSDAEEEEEEDDDSACFPGDAQVELLDGSSRPMASLEAGDTIRVSAGSSTSDGEAFAEVFFFSHKDPSRRYTFLEIRLESGHLLTLSPSHYTVLAGSNQLVPARLLKAGHQLQVASGEFHSVVAVQRVQKEGLFAPHTLGPQKTLVVDGVLASEFTESVHPRVGRPLLQLASLLYRVRGSLPHRVASVLHSNGHWLASTLRVGAKSAALE